MSRPAVSSLCRCRQRTGSLAKAITEQYGSLDALKAKVNAAGLGIYGSGWVWLVRPAERALLCVLY